jgi:hypothetical protein
VESRALVGLSEGSSPPPHDSSALPDDSSPPADEPIRQLAATALQPTRTQERVGEPLSEPVASPEDSSAPADGPNRQSEANGDDGRPSIDEAPEQGGETTEPEPTQDDEGVGEPPVDPVTPTGDSNAPPENPSTASDGQVAPPAPAQHIAAGGRLSTDAASLRDGEVLAVGLGLTDEARGGEPLSVRIVSVDGRRMETTAAPAVGSGSGLRLEIDPEWLTPGRYMIEVRTAEKTHLPLSRYVLEVP